MHKEEKISHLLNIRDTICYNLIEAEEEDAFELENELEKIQLELKKAGYDD